MRPFSGSQGNLESDWTQSAGQPSLERTGSQVLHEVRRSFVLEDLVLSKIKDQEKVEFSINFLLGRSEGRGYPGKTQIPESPPTYLSLEVDGRELSLLSGLLSRKIEIIEQRASSPKVLELETLVQSLRERLDHAESENQTLKQFLMETQRPRKVS
jgi:hypothetical protein